MPQKSPSDEALDPVPRCGIWPFTTDWVRAWLGLKEDPFSPACGLHDGWYVDQKHSRKQVDKKFLAKMLKIAQKYTDQEKREKYERRARLYYRLARAFGWIPWNLRKYKIIS